MTGFDDFFKTASRLESEKYPLYKVLVIHYSWKWFEESEEWKVLLTENNARYKQHQISQFWFQKCRTDSQEMQQWSDERSDEQIEAALQLIRLTLQHSRLFLAAKEYEDFDPTKYKNDKQRKQAMKLFLRDLKNKIKSKYEMLWDIYNGKGRSVPIEDAVKAMGLEGVREPQCPTACMHGNGFYQPKGGYLDLCLKRGGIIFCDYCKV